MYDPQTGDFINQTDYMYETYDGYEEDSANTHNSHNQQLMLNHQQNHGEDEMITYPRTKKPKVVKTDICIIGLLSNKDKEIISHSSFLFAISFFISLGFLFNFSFFFLTFSSMIEIHLSKRHHLDLICILLYLFVEYIFRIIILYCIL